MARYLEEGKPCPVCGSLSHPKPAIVSKDVPDEKEVARWKQKWQKAEEERNCIYQKASIIKGSLEVIENDYRIRKEQLKEDLDSLLLQEQEWTSKKESLEQNFKQKKRLEKKKEELLQAQTNFWEEKEKTKALYEKKLLKATKEEEKQRLIVQGKNLLLDELLKEQIELETFEKKLEQEILKLGDRKTEQLSDWIEYLEKQQSNFLKEQEAKKVKITINETVCHSMLEKQKERAELEQKYSLIKGLEQVANGKNKDRIVFEQYVLSSYFNDIIMTANLRLSKMTDGRYELAKVEKVVDGRTTDSLNLEILDNFTGKKRPVKTLSGGEAFKASLSLALGLSDVVQSYAGGIQIETLFIDEGFGALDEESLEQAMTTLQNLTEHNHLIGIISHVTELKERIEKQVIVEKGRNGSHIIIEEK